VRRLAAIIALTAAFGIAGHKEREWLDGTLLDPVYNKYFPDSRSGPPGTDGTENFNGVPYQHDFASGNPGTVDYYVVESRNTVYLVERVRLGVSAPPPLKRYQQVKFAVEKDKIWLSDGAKEYQGKVAKRFSKN
jgi:hypothetical protein